MMLLFFIVGMVGSFVAGAFAAKQACEETLVQFLDKLTIKLQERYTIEETTQIITSLTEEMKESDEDES